MCPSHRGFRLIEVSSYRGVCFIEMSPSYRGVHHIEEPYANLGNIEKYNSLNILGVTFQSDCRFSTHVKAKLYEANKCLFILRNLRQEGFNQDEIERLFHSLVLPKITYGLSVYGSLPAELCTAQRFLTRIFKRKYCPTQLCIYNLFEKSDKNILQKVKKLPNHPLRALMPTVKDCTKVLRTTHNQWPKVNTERYKQSFVNSLIFKYNLAM